MALFVVVALFASIYAFPVDGACSEPRLTTSGNIVGHQPTPKSQVCEYLGIPYATPPIGDLRFAAPQSFITTRTYVATNYSPDCPQPMPKQVIYPNATAQELRIMANFANQANNHNQSEDCLQLNIWSKNTNKENKPTLVFFHGGRFTGGTSNTPFYNGQFLADVQDVIVVTLNFRMNIFGYPGAPGQTQNLGLLDQRRAVEWVRDNIKAFGGTPSKITIVGQSSGAVAADMWAYAYRSDPIASGLISHSGNALSFPLNTPASSAANWYNVSNQVGCGASGDVMKCMRSIPFEKIRAAAALVRPPPSDSVTRSIPAFQPTPDNITVFEDYPSLSAKGAFARIPYVAGTAANESSYYKISTYGTNNTTAPDNVWDDFQLQSFWCPSYIQAWNRVKNDVSAWRVMYFGDWDNLRLYPGSGAYHGSDMNMVIGNSEEVSGLAPSADQVKLTKLVMEAWAAFAEDPVDGLTKKMGWPKYYLTKPTIIRLGVDNSPVPDFAPPIWYESLC